MILCYYMQIHFYFCQFMTDARDCESYLRQLQETIKRQYTCDKNSRLSKLEDLLQDSMVSTHLLSVLRIIFSFFYARQIYGAEGKTDCGFFIFTRFTAKNCVMLTSTGAQ